MKIKEVALSDLSFGIKSYGRAAIKKAQKIGKVKTDFSETKYHLGYTVFKE